MAAMRMMFFAAASLSVVSAAQETTMEVPQGSPVFPTIGQVDCLEEASSGRLCAATYECASGESGELWGDMGNPDGRRTTAADSDIALKRGCVVTVDGQAAVRWFSGFRPAGRTGPLLGVTAGAAAKRPVVRTPGTGGASSGLLLDWLISEHGYDVQDMLDRECGHIRDEATERRQECEAPLRWVISKVFGVALTPYTRCVAEFAIETEVRIRDRHRDLPEIHVIRDLSIELSNGHRHFGGSSCPERGNDDIREKLEECCAHYAAAEAHFGLAE